MDLSQMMKEDAKQVDIKVSNDNLQNIALLAEQQVDFEKQILQLEYDLEHAKDSLKQIQEYLLPEAMAATGMSEFKLTNGSKITIKDDVYASIKKEHISQAVNWLDDNGLGDIVKDKVDISFGRGESEMAKSLLDYCKGQGYNASETLSVHPMTLKATVKEQMAKGVQFPEECFSIAPVRKAIIKVK